MPNMPGVCNRKRILVITGTTGFDALVRLIDERRDLEAAFDITLQIGEGGYLPRYKNYFTFKPELKNDLDKYDFFVTHGGAGTVFMLLELGKRLLVVPNAERADKHQEELAEYVDSRRLCAVCRDLDEIVRCIKNIESSTANLVIYERNEFNATDRVLKYILEGTG